MELAEVRALEAVAQSEAGDGGPAEVQIPQLGQLPNASLMSTDSSHSLLVILHQLHSVTLSLSLQNQFYLRSEKKKLILKFRIISGLLTISGKDSQKSKASHGLMGFVYGFMTNKNLTWTQATLSPSMRL